MLWVNLLDNRKEHERKLTERFEKLVNSNINKDKYRYSYFNFHEQCEPKDFSALHSAFNIGGYAKAFKYYFKQDGDLKDE